MPLTDIEVRKAKPTHKKARIYDGLGLYLEVAPAGGKWWRFKYRFGKEKRLSLGTYPDVSLREARERRDAARRLLASGVDPGAHRKAVKAARVSSTENSFEIVTREWFAKFSRDWAPAHSSRIIRLFERDVFPWIGERPIGEIAAPELLSIIRRIEPRALETAHRALASCGQVFRYAVATGRASRDPSSDLRGALPPTKGYHFAATTEPVKLGGILRALDGYNGTPQVSSALRLAPLLFVRPGELRHAKWSQFDLDGAEWRYTATKTRVEHIVPLSRQAVAILLSLRCITGDGELVFHSARSPKRPMSDNAVLAAMRRMGIEKEEMCGHGFRAVARTILDEVLGVRVDYIEHQLAHKVKDPNGRAYNRTMFLKERREMMQLWADHLDGLKANSLSKVSANP